jgi:hypothetical protein
MQDARQAHNAKMLKALGLLPSLDDWEAIARTMGLTDADEAMRLFMELAMNPDFWIVDVSTQP